MKRPPSQSPAQGVPCFRASCRQVLSILKEGFDAHSRTSFSFEVDTCGFTSVFRLSVRSCRAFCKRVRIWDVLRCPELHRGSALASRTPASSALSCFTFGRSKSSVGRAAVKTDEESPNLPCTDLRHKLEQALFSASRSCCRVSLQAAESRSHVLGGLAVLPAGPAKPRFRLNVCFLQMLATQKVLFVAESRTLAAAMRPSLHMTIGSRNFRLRRGENVATLNCPSAWQFTYQA